MWSVAEKEESISFMTGVQKVLLTIFLLLFLISIMLFFSPYRPHHVFPEGLMIIIGTVLVNSFRRIYGPIVVTLTAIAMITSKLTGVDGYEPNNLPYIYLTVCTTIALLTCGIKFSKMPREDTVVKWIREDRESH
ncbi:MAG: hypothetical protein QXQ33_00620 [Nitrososphaerota archaeon]